MQKYALVVLLAISATLAIPVSLQGSADPMDTLPTPFLQQEENNIAALLDDSFEEVSGTAEEHAISEAIANETKSQNQKDSVDEGEVDNRVIQTDSGLANPQNTPPNEIETTKKAAFEANSSSLESRDPLTRDVSTETSDLKESQERSLENVLEGITNVTTSTKEQITELSNNYEEEKSTQLRLEDPQVIEEPIPTENIENDKLVEEAAVESEIEDAASSEGERAPTSQDLEFLSSEPGETETEVRTKAPIEDLETGAPETEEVNDNSLVISSKAFEVESEEGLENSSNETGIDAEFMESKSEPRHSMAAEGIAEIVNEENYGPVAEDIADYSTIQTEMSPTSLSSFVREVISTEAPIKEISPATLMAVPSTSVKDEELEVEKDLENLSIESKEATSEINETESEFQDWVSVGEMTEEVENTTITESSIEAKEFNVPSDEEVEGQENSLETSIESISPDMLTTALPGLESLKNDSQVVVEAELKDVKDISLKISRESTEGVTTAKATPHSEIQPFKNETRVPTSTETYQSGIHLENEGIISNEAKEGIEENSENELNQTEIALSTSEHEKSLGDSLELGPESEPKEVQTDISKKEISETSKQETIPEDQIQTDEQELVEETRQNRNPETVEEEIVIGTTTSSETAITTDRTEYPGVDEDAKTEIAEGEPEISPQGDEQETEETVVPSVPMESADDETVPLSESHPEPRDSAQPDSSNFGALPALEGEDVAPDISTTTSTSSVLRFSFSSAALLLLFPHLFGRL